MAFDPFFILYEDDHLIAIHKPAGIHVHRNAQSGREPTVLALLRNQIDQYLYPVHRLDRATSGVLLFAKSSESARQIAQLFRERQVSKKYLAVVRGFLEGDGWIEKPLREFPDTPLQEARTRFESLATVELPFAVGAFPTTRYSLVAVYPETGRRQQIRRHLGHLSHPIIGDTAKGDGKHNRFFRDKFHFHRLLLMATELRFETPNTREECIIRGPVHRQVAKLFDRLGWLKHLAAWEIPADLRSPAAETD